MIGLGISIANVTKQRALSCIIAVAGARNSAPDTLRLYDTSGQMLLALDHGDSVLAVTFDRAGNIITGGLPYFDLFAGNTTTRKYNPAGYPLWKANHGESVRGVAADSHGAVISVGDAVFDGEDVISIRNYNPSGEPTGAFGPEAPLADLGIDADDNIIVAGEPDRNGHNLHKLDPRGNSLWVKEHGDVLFAVAIAPNGNIYAGGFPWHDVTIRSYAPDGAPLWTGDHGANVYALAVDRQGNLFVAGERAADLKTTRKYDANHNLVWSQDHGAAVYGLAVDYQGNLYTAGLRTGNITTRAYDPDGNLLWTADHGNHALAIATYCP
jgi:hypothetical protein